MRRRHVLRHVLRTTLPLATGWALGHAAWAATAAPPARLIVVFLRGAVDGLNVVVPHTEPAYRSARPTLALGAPGSDGGMLELSASWGLHPALAPLLPWWQARQLGFVQAAGSPDATRSHFDAQDFMESGTPGRKNTPDGWMNRLLGALPQPANGSAATRAVSIGAVLPRMYAGPHPVANIAAGPAATRPLALDRPRIAQAFDTLYQGDDPLSRAYQEAQLSRREVMASLSPAMSAEMQAANNGAPLPDGFPGDAARLATLMRKDPRVQLAVMAVGGWDTHAHQGGATGPLANRLAPLGQGLATLAERLGPVLADTVIVVMSEFGRTVRQNGTGGTDHGHGNVIWLLGGPVAGGVVHGRWPGLADSALYEGRDLAITTDFRQVLTAIAERHLRLPEAQLEQVFPGWRGASAPVLKA